LDPVPGPSRIESDLRARVAALEAQVAGKTVDARGQPTAPRPPPIEDTSVRCYTIRETAWILRLGLSMTYDGVVNGRIPAVKIGGRWLVPHDALVRLLQTEQPRPAAIARRRSSVREEKAAERAAACFDREV
jgi:excisionase family DNA binding protein